jgi:hypothetical protein
MSTTEIETIREGDFTAEAALRDRALTVTISGNADLNVKAQLDRFLAGVHAEVNRQGLEEVTVDFRTLDFMNSSCLKCLVSWISQIQDAPPGKQYRLTFISSPAMYWQKRSLHALSCLAADLVTVQT